MKTKVFLHGGFASHQNEKNDDFFKEILINVSDTPKILLVLFSKELEKITINSKEDIAQFERNKGTKVISYEIATEDDFIEQVAESDVIYFHGGSTSKLLAVLKKFDNLIEMFKGKVIAGESAGAYALSESFYSIREEGLFEGLGIVPVETICHYSKEREGLVESLPGRSNRLLLPDYTYEVFEI